jgi:hypothetical protein
LVAREFQNFPGFLPSVGSLYKEQMLVPARSTCTEKKKILQEFLTNPAKF